MKSREEIDGSRIGLLGQSQAGWVIPVAAAESRDVAFTTIFSGTTVTLGEEDYFSQLTGNDPFWDEVYKDLSWEEISRRLAERGPSLFDPLPSCLTMSFFVSLVSRKTAENKKSLSIGALPGWPRAWSRRPRAPLALVSAARNNSSRCSSPSGLGGPRVTGDRAANAGGTQKQERHERPVEG